MDGWNFGLSNPKTRNSFRNIGIGDPIGFIWLFHIDDIAARGELGYWICPEEQGQGYATESKKLALKYAFDERGLQKVVARAFEGNAAPRRVLDKLGFKEEGYLRDHYFVNGEYIDTYLFGLLADDR
ncbi:GNAT family protein [Halorubrum sp. AD140]|uniref:GNAT family N-acetyltransferase n=1 Tax=Halorubrum sp. AD140 TaxID=3050073 RepID=UPI002ACC7FFC|nr:GNAT family protein [Halorubrum sp. AD140]MDZ5810788.1 GNAT family protein [Halorubrum sp. AD140]